MSGNYRVEVSANNRAGCSATHCKNEGHKITKGEIRQGVTVQFKEHTSMKWRHWGCVTPSVLHNWNETTQGDFDLVDGFDELPDDAKEKVKRAFEQGHVDDEDWNGDPELNRYNPDKKMQGMFKKPETQAERKKREKAEAAANGDAPAKKKKTTKKRKPADDEEDDEDEAEAPPPKKSRAKKAKTEDANGEDEAAPPPKKSRAKKAKAEEVDDAEDDEAPKPKPAAKKSRAKKADAEADEPKAKAPKRKTKAKKAAVEEDGEEDD
ncbi:hypothetical protein PRZ48_015026 [Zasmidium cellare]|uniref:PARP-type domain-containing protein n=1 Tax=Zasmidium cellare TaxID=395010 RepID=A0ABR0DY28_ZASCE|nr:hypothetical protein PRZ48_015026 [Zasmidium cellare]